MNRRLKSVGGSGNDTPHRRGDESYKSLMGVGNKKYPTRVEMNRARNIRPEIRLHTPYRCGDEQMGEHINAQKQKYSSLSWR